MDLSRLSTILPMDEPREQMYTPGKPLRASYPFGGAWGRVDGSGHSTAYHHRHRKRWMSRPLPRSLSYRAKEGRLGRLLLLADEDLPEGTGDFLPEDDAFFFFAAAFLVFVSVLALALVAFLAGDLAAAFFLPAAAGFFFLGLLSLDSGTSSSLESDE